MQQAAQHAHAVVNRAYQALAPDRLDTAARERLALLLTRIENENKSPWHRLKGEPKQPTAVANLLIFHNVVTISNALERFVAEDSTLSLLTNASS